MGIYPQFEETDEIIEACSQCYLLGLPCADGYVTEGEQFVFDKVEGGYCEETKGKYKVCTLGVCALLL